MTPTILLFTGPPASSSVVEPSCTVSGFEPPFIHLFRLPTTTTTTAAASAPAATPTPYTTAWRSLALHRQPLHTGFTQTHAANVSTFANGAFFTTAEATVLDLDDDDDHDDDDSHEGATTTTPASQDLLAQFCEQSIGLHTMSDAWDSQSLVDCTTESLTTSVLSQDAHVARPRHLSDLEDVPSAKQVTALEPQTITLNIIVGVLSVAQPRTVTTRWGSSLSLIELLVGDDTATGFAVTFWVPKHEVAESDVVALRRQDVVLLENVALHVFQNKVYGQSLRRGLTKLHLLWRADGSGHYSSRSLRARGGDPQREKTRLVKDWVMRFVGLDPQARRRSGSSWDRPPDDSQ
ncbi:hypothetical protein E4U42_004183 [Claviceps africana]|uniref:Uncharacterized protein n=1 Tax=Claviceps africana TaxID=83212 RepID=A0A8K0NL03_9HYPO|nr:hypothetical protein E4U42_004183 [Claviceps africana]